MEITTFLTKLEAVGIDSYAGVPDSLLASLGDHLTATYGVGARHVIAANEGGAVGVAAGHYLATGRPGLVYLQNSGIGNTVNPVCSLLDSAVYGIPVLFVVGWRGEPGVKDEPQHVFQGEATVPLLEVMGLKTAIITAETTDAEFDAALAEFAEEFAHGRSAAFVVKKGALTGGAKGAYANEHPSTREELVNLVVDSLRPEDIVVSTTGKLSRELFEAREARSQGHGADFLTVGSMGHSSMIGLGIALEKPGRRVFVLDGDGAVLMHTGALAVIGALAPANLVHIVVNNEAHESVGGMPTVAPSVDFPVMALACGYARAFTAQDATELAEVLEGVDELDGEGPILVEVKASIGARADLGRPTTTPQENKRAFMAHVSDASAPTHESETTVGGESD